MATEQLQDVVKHPQSAGDLSPSDVHDSTPKYSSDDAHKKSTANSPEPPEQHVAGIGEVAVQEAGRVTQEETAPARMVRAIPVIRQTP